MQGIITAKNNRSITQVRIILYISTNQDSENENYNHFNINNIHDNFRLMRESENCRSGHN